MLRTILFSTAPIVIAALTAGVAMAETRIVDVTPFTSASFESAIIGDIVAGVPQSISIEGDPAALEDIRIDVVGGKLRVWRDSDLWDFLAMRNDEVKVTITVPSLEALVASSASRVEARGLSGDIIHLSVSSAAVVVAHDVAATAARINASSAGQLTMTGSCETAHVEVSSAGQFNADTFECVDVTISASSAGRALLFATGLVTAEASSAAKIELAGHPRHVDDQVSSGADVNILE